MTRTTKPRKSSKAASQSTEHVAEQFDPASLLRALDAYASHEARITERFYEIFFERRPDTLELFGPHSIAEREEMLRETLHSLHALHEGHVWLTDNLVALGRSHWEYGVTKDMYASFVESLIDCGREVLGDEVDEPVLASLRIALVQISDQMSEAGEQASIRRGRASST